MKILKKKGILYHYFAIVILILLIMFIAFLFTQFFIKRYSYQENYQANKVVFEQIKQRMTSSEREVNLIFQRVAYDTNLQKILTTEDFVERASYQKWFQTFADDNQSISPNIRSSAVFDKKGDLLFSRGDMFLSLPKITADSTKPIYSPIQKSNKEKYIYVVLPVMDWNSQNMNTILGHVVIILDTNEIDQIAQESLINPKNQLTFLDNQDQLLYQAGVKKLSQKQDYLTLKYTSKRTGYKVVFKINEQELGRGVHLLGTIMSTTFVLIFVIVLFTFVLLYRMILRPIHRQVSFMENYVDNVDQRIEVIDDNEIGTMAKKMNSMLDDIEHLNQDIIQQQKAYYAMKYQKKQTEIIALRSQINPHFLYNTFDCIRGIALYNEQKDIAKMVQHLSNFFRYTIKGTEWVTVEEEFTSLAEYAAIIDFRFSSRYQIDFQIEEELKTTKIPKMLLQPLLENAVFHGLGTKMSGKVIVSALKKGRFLHLSVTDNGSGIPEAELKKLIAEQQELDQVADTIPTMDDLPVEGIGLTNVYHRMQLFYGGEADLHIVTNSSGTKITLIIPISED